MKEGCHWDLDCQYLHKSEDKPNKNQKDETKERVTKAEIKICCDKDVQTQPEEKYDEDCVCKTKSTTNELFFKDRRMICIFNRAIVGKC